MDEGAWRLVLSHRAGSLEAAVAGARRRNLAVSGGILILLVGAVATLVASVQRAQRLARLQTEFVAGITHDLRTPLAAIRSAGENLADGVVGGQDRVKRYGRLVEREARRLTELIADTLEYAGIESGRTLERSELVSVAELIEDARKACRWLAEDEGVAVEADLPSSLVHVLGDRAALRKVFTNLLTNAIKYGGRGNRVTLRAREEEGTVETSVEDRGPGIRPEDCPTSSSPFTGARSLHGADQRLRSRALPRAPHRESAWWQRDRRERGGVRHRLLSAASGGIEGSGTGDRRGGVVRDGVPARASVRTGARKRRRGPRILLVEDEPSLVLTLTDRLEAEGYEVQSSGDGGQAVELATALAFDLLLLDVALPGKNGFDVCRDIRQRGFSVPVMMLTARGDVSDRVVGLKLGADDYLVKPFEIIELLARIEALMRRSRGQTASAADGYVFGDIRVDFGGARVLRSGAEVTLSAMEYKLLRHFIEHRGMLISRDELLDKVWGYEAMPYTRTVDVHVASLRQKLERNPARPDFILTVHRLGYRFAA